MTTISVLLPARIIRTIAAESHSLPWVDTAHPSYDTLYSVDREDTAAEVKGFSLDSMTSYAPFPNVVARVSVAGRAIQVALPQQIPQQPNLTERKRRSSFSDPTTS